MNQFTIAKKKRKKKGSSWFFFTVYNHIWGTYVNVSRLGDESNKNEF